jgi:hypothetical protein
MSVCAVIQKSNNVVINKIVAEPTDAAPDNTYLILCDTILCDIGWIWNGTEFINPNPIIEETDGN